MQYVFLKVWKNVSGMKDYKAQMNGLFFNMKHI